MKNLLSIVIYLGIFQSLMAQSIEAEGVANFKGPIQVNGDPGIANQILVSTGPGSAPEWSDAALTGGGRFWATIATNSETASTPTGRAGWNLAAGDTQEDSIDFASAQVSGSDISVTTTGLTNNKITIHKTGLYHFEGMIRYFVSTNLSLSSTVMKPRVTLDFLVNQTGLDPNIVLVEDLMDVTGSAATENAANAYNLSVKFQLNIHLIANATCTFITGFTNLRFPGGTNILAMGITSGGYIAGHFIAE